MIPTTSPAVLASDPYAPIGPHLERVVDTIVEVATSEAGRHDYRDGEHLSDRLMHVLSTPGKRMRPAIALLTCQLWGREICSKEISLAVAVELLHIASLIHDDVVDTAKTRRGHATAYDLWGSKYAVLLGDYVFAASARYMTATGSMRVVRRFADTISELSRGEMLELSASDRPEYDVPNYLSRTYDKTASLFRTASECGAVLGGATEAGISAAADYGTRLGMAFQIRDDVLDYESTAEELGKPVNQDLLSGKLTLPALMAAEDSECARDLDTFLMASHEEREVMLGEMVDSIRSCGGIVKSEQRASEYINSALESVARAAPPSESYDALRMIAENVRR